MEVVRMMTWKKPSAGVDPPIRGTALVASMMLHMTLLAGCGEWDDDYRSPVQDGEVDGVEEPRIDVEIDLPVDPVSDPSLDTVVDDGGGFDPVDTTPDPGLDPGHDPVEEEPSLPCDHDLGTWSPC